MQSLQLISAGGAGIVSAVFARLFSVFPRAFLTSAASFASACAAVPAHTLKPRADHSLFAFVTAASEEAMCAVSCASTAPLTSCHSVKHFSEQQIGILEFQFSILLVCKAVANVAVTFASAQYFVPDFTTVLVHGLTLSETFASTQNIRSFKRLLSGHTTPHFEM
jgi:hypothetical protein